MGGSQVNERLDALLQFFSQLKTVLVMLHNCEDSLKVFIEQLEDLLEKSLGGSTK